MANLRCHDKTCRFNHTGLCSKEAIDVSYNAKCMSYEFDSGNNTDMEMAQDLTYRSDAYIHCHDSECMNNKEYRCSLDNLRIDRINDNPVCVNERPLDTKKG